MPVESHDDGVVELELAALAGLKEGATREQLQDTLARLRQFLHQVDARQLEPDELVRSNLAEAVARVVAALRELV